MRMPSFRLLAILISVFSISAPFVAFADELPPESIPPAESAPLDPKFNLTVIKNVIQHEGGTAIPSDFGLIIHGGGNYSNTIAGSAEGVTDTHVPTGDYSVTEAPQTGFTASYSEGCSGNVADAGSDVTCTVTNTENPGLLTVTKVVVNDNGGEASVEDFPLFVNASSVTSGQENEVVPGTYTITETNETDYTGTFSGDCDASGHVTVKAGESKNCILTNDDPTDKGTLIIIKHVVNDNVGTKSAGDFTMRVMQEGRELTLGEFHLAVVEPVFETQVASFPGAETPGTSIQVTPGYYRVTEDSDEGYTSSTSADCTGTIAAGETKTCTITNDDIGTAPQKGKGGLGSGDSISGTLPPVTPPPSSGSSGSPSPSTPPAPPSPPTGDSTTPPAGRVLGAEDVNTTLGACVLDEQDASLIVADPDRMTAMQNIVRNLGLENRYHDLIARVLPTDISDAQRAAAMNFGIYGTGRTANLGIGERAGVLASYVDAFHTLPASDCEWQDVIRIATTKKPAKHSQERELSAHSTFLRIYGRVADLSNAHDDLAISMMSYGLRPAIRSLDTERAAIRQYRSMFGDVPRTTFEWDTMRAIAYAGVAR